MNELEQRARVLLAQASVIAEASCAALKEQTSHGKTESSAPTIAGSSTFEDAARAIRRARGDFQLREAVEHVEGLIREIRYSRIPNVDPATREGKLLIGLDPRPIQTVAYAYGFSERSVYRWRAEARKLQERVSAANTCYPLT